MGVTLLEYAHRAGLVRPGRAVRIGCFYCGLRASSVDHRRPTTRRGSDRMSNLHPSCQRCNQRKGARSVEEFREGLARVARAAGFDETIRFHGEGAHGPALRTLRAIVSSWYLVGRKLVERKEGEPLRPARPPKEVVRWRGRWTFRGQQALHAIRRIAGCSAPTIERFIMGVEVLPGHRDRLRSACLKLKLDVDELRELAPPTSRS